MTAAACPAVFYADGTFCITFWQNVAIVDGGGLCDVEHMLTMERAYQALAQRFTGGIVSCVVIQPGTPVPPRDGLREGARLLRDLGNAMTRVAVVIEDVGVAAQVFRTIVRGINVASRSSKLVAVGDLRAAIDVLTPMVVPATGEMEVPSALRIVLQSARARYASMFPPPPAPRPQQRKSGPSVRGLTGER